VLTSPRDIVGRVSFRRAALLLSASLGALALSGCSVIATTEPTPGAASTATSAPPVVVTDDYPFNAASGLDSSSSIRWIDAMGAADGFTVAVADDGNGRWSYQQTSSQCIIGFWQADVRDLDLTQDERTLSDTMLAEEYGTTDVASVTKYAYDDALPTQTTGTGTVRVRSVVSTNSKNGASSIVSARVFRTAKVGLLTSVDCPDGFSAATVRDELAPNDIRMVIRPGS